jgi:tetratricopeptide (TPR) repeat protein
MEGTSMKVTEKSPQSSFTSRLPRIIGRKHIIDNIKEALDDKTGKPYVIYLEADGGMGKTRILEEVGNIQKEKKIKFSWGGKIDLYHEKYHSPENLQKAIADGLDPRDVHFKKYRALQLDLEEKQRQGFSGPAIEKLRREVDEQFMQDYRALAKKNRVALCFDTMELTQHESDIVLKICQVENENTVARNWILNFVGQAPNTVTVFAGRPKAEIKEEDVTGPGTPRFQKHSIKGLSEGESREYLKERIKQIPSLVEEDIQGELDWIIEISEGRPIRLALCVDLLIVRGSGSLSGIEKEDIDKELVERLFIDPDTPEIFHYLIIARKGLDKGLFFHLMGGSKDEIRESFAQLDDLEIVKKPEGSDKYFLHDEVYDLADKYFQNETWFGQSYNSIVEYYHALRDSTVGDARQDVTVELLYYEHQKNPSDGYHKYYARWDEEAIRSHETSFDMRLRDEGLRFMDRYTNPGSPFFTKRVSDAVSRPDIDRDCAVRWVKRYVARGQFKKADEVATSIRHSTHPNFAWDSINDPIYKAGLFAAWAMAKVYIGGPENIILDMLNEAIQHLMNVQNFNEDQRWWRARILGTAYNYLGYLHRSKGHYSLALEQYKRALPYFSDSNIQDERANTLNNMAFLQAVLGRVQLARKHVDDALMIRKGLGKAYPIALSLNTRGIIHVLEDHPMWGERECRSALEMCQKMGDPRGIGLTQIGLGLALRKKGTQWKMEVGYSQEDAETFFREAEDHFKSASEIFSESVNEPIRLWEAYNELGSLYCDWAWLTRKWQDGDRKPHAVDQYDQSIMYQQNALRVAEEENLPFQAADSHDDLAQAYADRSFLLSEIGRRADAIKGLETASVHLAKVLEAIPSEYQLVKEKGFVPGPEPEEAYWLSLGKYYLQRGIWIFEEIKRELLPVNPENLREGIRNFALATAYFHQYWPQSYAFETGLRACAERIQRAGVAANTARAIVREVAEEFAVNLDPLLETIDNVLGI